MRARRHRGAGNWRPYRGLQPRDPPGRSLGRAEPWQGGALAGRRPRDGGRALDRGGGDARYPSPSSGRVDARSAAGWGACRRQRRAAKKTPPRPSPKTGREKLDPAVAVVLPGWTPVTARGRTPRPTARQPWPRPWRRRRRDGGRALRRGGSRHPSPSSGRVDARSAAGWGACSRQRRAAEKTPPRPSPKAGREKLDPAGAVVLRGLFAGHGERSNTSADSAAAMASALAAAASRWRASASRRWTCSDIPPRLRGGWTREARPGGVLAGGSAVPRKRPHPGPPRRRGGRRADPAGAVVLGRVFAGHGERSNTSADSAAAMASALAAAAARWRASASRRWTWAANARCHALEASGTVSLRSLPFDMPGIEAALPLANCRNLWPERRYVDECAEIER